MTVAETDMRDLPDELTDTLIEWYSERHKSHPTSPDRRRVFLWAARFALTHTGSPHSTPRGTRVYRRFSGDEITSSRVVLSALRDARAYLAGLIVERRDAGYGGWLRLTFVDGTHRTMSYVEVRQKYDIDPFTGNEPFDVNMT